MQNLLKKIMSILTRSAFALVLVMLMNKGIALVKQSILVSNFCATQEMDSFLVASDFMIQVGSVLFSALSVTFLSTYARYLNQEGKAAAADFFRNTLVLFIPLSAIVILLAYAFSEYIVDILAIGFPPDQKLIAAGYIRLFSVIVIGICISNISTAALEGEKRFLPGKASNIIQSIIVIAVCLYFKDNTPIEYIIYSVIAFYAVQNLLLLSLLWKNDSFQIGKIKIGTPQLELVKVAVPVFISNALLQVNFMVDRAIASSMEAGSITVLSYGNYIFSSIHAIIVGSLCAILLSLFSNSIANNDSEKTDDHLLKGLSTLALIMIPLTIFVFLFADQVIDILFGYGKFNEAAVSRTGLIVKCYVVGLIFAGVRDILVNLHYANTDTRRPFINSCAGVGSNICLSILLGTMIGLPGIAIASAIAYAITALLSIASGKRYIGLLNIRRLILNLTKVCIASLLGGLFIIWCPVIDNHGALLAMTQKAAFYFTVTLLVLKLMRYDFSLILKK